MTLRTDRHGCVDCRAKDLELASLRERVALLENVVATVLECAKLGAAVAELPHRPLP